MPHTRPWHDDVTGMGLRGATQHMHWKSAVDRSGLDPGGPPPYANHAWPRDPSTTQLTTSGCPAPSHCHVRHVVTPTRWPDRHRAPPPIAADDDPVHHPTFIQPRTTAQRRRHQGTLPGVDKYQARRPMTTHTPPPIILATPADPSSDTRTCAAPLSKRMPLHRNSSNTKRSHA